MKLENLLEKIMDNSEMIKGVLSNKSKASLLEYKKVELKPIFVKDEIFIQWTYYIGNQVKHKNISQYETKKELTELLDGDFRQLVLFTEEADYQVLVGKKGKMKILSQPSTKKSVEITHNRKKNYILEEGVPYPFLVYLGVMSEDGKVKHQRYDKFKQLNRYLEIVSDVMKHLDQDFIRIVDFGCGKAYLTFALYHYLVNILGKNVEIIGLDLKESVIQFGNETAQALNYEKLKFYKGDIESFNEANEVDMVISLHACDTATDDALIKGMEWNAKVLIAVPCCQHELFPKIKSGPLNGLLKYGIYKERISALLTDALRASLLEQNGYQVDAVEFVSMEHTAKNIMLRAVKTGKINNSAMAEFESLKEIFNLNEFHMEKNL